MAKNPLKKTKGLYVGEPQEKKKGIMKKVLIVSAVAALTTGIFLGGFFGGKAYQANQTEKVQDEIVTVVPTPEVKPEEKPVVPGGEVKGDINTSDVVLMEDSQMLIASKIYTDLRADVPHDITSIDIVGTKIVTEGAETYLQAYISVLEGEEGSQEKAMYVVGYSDIQEVEDIPDAEVRKIKAGTVADIQKYVSIEKYLEDDAKVEDTKEFFENKDSINGIEDLYVRVSNTNRKGNFVSTMDYIADLSSGDISIGTIINKGAQYNVSNEKLLDMIVSGEKTAEPEHSR